MKAKFLAAAAGLALAALAVACTEEPARKRTSHRGQPRSGAAPEKAMSNMWKNPADKPGAKVYRPNPIPTARYVSARERVEDSNGDYLVLESGHAGGIGQYTFGNKSTDLIAYGGYRSTGGGQTGLTVFEVVDLRSELGAAPKLPPSQFDLKRIAEMFRGWMDTRVPNHRTEVIVVDSRPERLE